MDAIAICPLCDHKCIVMSPVRRGNHETFPIHYRKGRASQREFCEAGGWLVEDDEYVMAANA